MNKDRNKDLDIITKQVDTNCVNTTPKDTDSFDVTSFAHHAAERNHTIVDGFHLEFLVLI